MNITAHILVISSPNNSIQQQLISYGIYRLVFDDEYTWQQLYLLLEEVPIGFTPTLILKKNYSDYIGSRFIFSEGDLRVNTG